MPANDLEGHVRAVLRAIDPQPEREVLARTPERVARALAFFTKGHDEDPRQVINGALFRDEEYSEMIVLKDIDFYSLCEHHILPFFGKAHVAYLPNRRIVGISKLARLVEVYARRRAARRGHLRPPRRARAPRGPPGRAPRARAAAPGGRPARPGRSQPAARPLAPRAGHPRAGGRALRAVARALPRGARARGARLHGRAAASGVRRARAARPFSPTRDPAVSGRGLTASVRPV